MEDENRQGDMILYCIITMYQLLMVMVHKTHYYPNKKTILILPSFFRGYDVDFDLLKCAYFDEIYWMDYSKWGMSKSFIQETGMKLYREIVPYDLKEFYEIIVAVDQFPFSAFLVMNEINFSYLEEASGAYLHIDKLIRGVKYVETHLAEIGLSCGTINAKSEYIKTIYANVPKNYIGDYRVKRFSIMEELSFLSESNLSTLVEVFGLDYQDLPRWTNVTILLTGHLANVRLLTLQEQIEIYKLIVDYFVGEKKLIVKPHPSDDVDYRHVFPKATVLASAFPVELIGNVIKERGWRILTLESSSLNNLCVEGITFPYEFIFEYRVIHEAVVIASLHLYLISCYDISLYLEEKMMKIVEYIEKESCLNIDFNHDVSAHFFYNLDEMELNFIEKIFNHEKNDAVIVCPILMEDKYVVPKKIKIYENNKVEERLIFLYTKNELIVEKIAEFYMEYTLPYSKVLIRVEKLTHKKIEQLILEAKMEMIQREIEEIKKENKELKLLLDRRSDSDAGV